MRRNYKTHCRIFQKVFLLLSVLVLSACASQKTEVRTVRVEVPVQVPCRAPSIAEPQFVAAGLKKTDSLEVKVRALLAERRQRIGYERELQAAVFACQ